MTFLPGSMRVSSAGHSAAPAEHGRDGHRVSEHPRADLAGDLLEAAPAPSHAPVELDAEQLEEAASADLPELTHGPVAKTNGKRAPRARAEGVQASFAAELAKNVEAGEDVHAASPAETDQLDRDALREPSTDGTPSALARHERAGMPRPVVNGSDETPKSEAMSVSPRLTTGSHVHGDVTPELRSYAAEHPTSAPHPALPELLSIAAAVQQASGSPTPATTPEAAGPTLSPHARLDVSSGHADRPDVETELGAAPRHASAVGPRTPEPVSPGETPSTMDPTAVPAAPPMRDRHQAAEPALSSIPALAKLSPEPAAAPAVAATPSAPAAPALSPAPSRAATTPSAPFPIPQPNRSSADHVDADAHELRAPAGTLAAVEKAPTSAAPGRTAPGRAAPPVSPRSAARAGAAYAQMTTDGDVTARRRSDAPAVAAARSGAIAPAAPHHEEVEAAPGTPAHAAPRAGADGFQRFPDAAGAQATASSVSVWPPTSASDSVPAGARRATAQASPATVAHADAGPRARTAPAVPPATVADRGDVAPHAAPVEHPPASSAEHALPSGGAPTHANGRAPMSDARPSAPPSAKRAPKLPNDGEPNGPAERAPASSLESTRQPLAHAAEAVASDPRPPVPRPAQDGPRAQPGAVRDQAPAEAPSATVASDPPPARPHRDPGEARDQKTNAPRPAPVATLAAASGPPSAPAVARAPEAVDESRRDGAGAPVQASPSATAKPSSVPAPAVPAQVAPVPHTPPSGPPLPRSPNFSSAPPASSGVPATGESTAAHPTPHVDSSSAVPPLFRLSETRRVQAAHLDLAQQSYQPGIVATPSPSAKGFGTGSRLDKTDKPDKSKKSSLTDPAAALAGAPVQPAPFEAPTPPPATRAAPRSSLAPAPAARSSRGAQPIDAIHALAAEGATAPAPAAVGASVPRAPSASDASKGARLGGRPDEPSPREVTARDATAASVPVNVVDSDRPSRRAADAGASAPAAEPRPAHAAPVVSDKAPAPASHQPAMSSSPPPVVPSAVVPQPPLAAQPLYELATSDPSLQATLGKNAHLHLDAGAAGPLSLHVTVRDGVADLEVEGPAAERLNMRPEELRRALAGEGISLGQFVSRANESADARAHQDASQNQGGNQGQPDRAQSDPSPPPAATPFTAQSGASSYHGESRRHWQNEAPDPAERDRRAGSPPAGTTTSTTSDAPPARRRGVHVTA